MISFPCPHCNKPLRVAEQYAGQTFACPACQKGVQVPSTPPPGADVELVKAPVRPRGIRDLWTVCEVATGVVGGLHIFAWLSVGSAVQQAAISAAAATVIITIYVLARSEEKRRQGD